MVQTPQLDAGHISAVPPTMCFYTLKAARCTKAPAATPDGDCHTTTCIKPQQSLPCALLHCQALPHNTCTCCNARLCHSQNTAAPATEAELCPTMLYCHMCFQQGMLCASQYMPSCATQQSPTDLAHMSLRKGYEPIKKLEGTMGQATLSQLLHEGSQPSTMQLRHAFCRDLQSKGLHFLGSAGNSTQVTQSCHVGRAIWTALCTTSRP